jgi:hypothetical protein
MEGADFNVAVGARVLVGGKYAGIIRYVPERRSALVGVELDRARGEGDGSTESGEKLFEFKPLHGKFVREERRLVLAMGRVWLTTPLTLLLWCIVPSDGEAQRRKTLLHRCDGRRRRRGCLRHMQFKMQND